MRVLVTGSAGLIGRQLVSVLRENGHEVIECDRASKLFVDRIDCLDIFRTSFLVDVAIHCAAITGGIEGTTFNAARQSAINAQLDGAFFQWALRTKPRRIVYVSSSCAYPLLPDAGMQHSRLLREQDARPGFTTADGTPYGTIKLAGEVMALAAREEIPVSIVRPFAVYGSDQELCRMLPMFVNRALSNAPTFEVWGDGHQASDFIHVEDAANAILTMLDLDIDGPVNLATGIGTSVDAAAHMVMDAVGVQREIVHNLSKPSGPAWRAGDPTFLQTFYKPTISIEEGIGRMVEYWRKAVPTSYGRGDDLA